MTLWANARAAISSLSGAVQAPIYYVPSSITLVEGGAVTGDVSGVQGMLDGSLYEVVEAAATPGFDIEFNFASVSRTPSEIAVRLWYDGLATHICAVDLWNYTGTPAYDRLFNFTTTVGYTTFWSPVQNFARYVSAGAAKLRVVHVSAGNVAHSIHFDYVALRASR